MIKVELDTEFFRTWNDRDLRDIFAKLTRECSGIQEGEDAVFKTDVEAVDFVWKLHDEIRDRLEDCNYELSIMDFKTGYHIDEEPNKINPDWDEGRGYGYVRYLINVEGSRDNAPDGF